MTTTSFPVAAGNVQLRPFRFEDAPTKGAPPGAGAADRILPDGVSEAFDTVKLFLRRDDAESGPSGSAAKKLRKLAADLAPIVFCEDAVRCLDEFLVARRTVITAGNTAEQFG